MAPLAARQRDAVVLHVDVGCLQVALAAVLHPAVLAPRLRERRNETGQYR